MTYFPMQRVSDKPAATKKVILRTIKLFLLGLILQGGYFHGRKDLTYGVDVTKMRLMGVLQRISIGYLFASVLEIWFVNNIVVDSVAAFAKKYCIQWMIAILLGSLYMCLLYGLYVPNWAFEVSSMSWTTQQKGYGSNTQTLRITTSKQQKKEFWCSVFLAEPATQQFEVINHLFQVFCGVRGSLEPPCNAVGFIDRIFLGEHLYKHPVYRRTQNCSVNSPDYGPLPPNSPGWCLAPFEPEGILSSLMAAVTCFVSLYNGQIIVHFKGHMERVIMWSISSFFLLISGFVLVVLGVPLSKPLYTLSYMCVTAGASGLLLTIIFYIVDVKHIRKPTIILQWVGMNALIIYALAACDIFPAAVQGFYWCSPKYNLISMLQFFSTHYMNTTSSMVHTSSFSSGKQERGEGWSNILDYLLYNRTISEVDSTESLLQAMFHSTKWGTGAFVTLEILFWGVVAGCLHMNRLYIRL